MGFLHKLRAAWAYVWYLPIYSVDADGESGWTEKDAVWLYRTLNSHSGQKLKQRMVNFSLQAASTAVRNPNNTQYANGVAAGIFMHINAIEAHAKVPEQQEEILAEFEEQTA